MRTILVIAAIIGILWWVGSTNYRDTATAPTAAELADDVADGWYVVANHRDCVRLDMFSFPNGWKLNTPNDVRAMFTSDGARYITDRVESNAAGQMKMVIHQFIWHGEQYNFIFFESGKVCRRITAATFKD